MGFENVIFLSGSAPAVKSPFRNFEIDISYLRSSSLPDIAFKLTENATMTDAYV